MFRCASFSLAVALTCSATALRAQVVITDTVFVRAQAPTGTIRGTVQTSDGKPVVDAQATIGDLASVRTNSAGSFFLLRVPRGTHTITVRTFAAPPATDTVAVAGGDTVAVAIRLLEKLTELETVRAIGQRLMQGPGYGALEDFYRRRQPIFGIRPVVYYVDGMQTMADDMFSWFNPNDIEAMEISSRLLRTPAGSARHRLRRRVLLDAAMRSGACLRADRPPDRRRGARHETV